MVIMMITFGAFVWMAAKVYRKVYLCMERKLPGKRCGNG